MYLECTSVHTQLEQDFMKQQDLVDTQRMSYLYLYHTHDIVHAFTRSLTHLTSASVKGTKICTKNAVP